MISLSRNKELNTNLRKQRRNRASLRDQHKFYPFRKPNKEPAYDQKLANHGKQAEFQIDMQ